MKTALMKTSFWQDDDIFELNSDTRFFYLCLLTNPNRDITPAFKCGDRMMSAFTGYTAELISVCRKQLIEKGKINYVDGFYIFTKQDFVEPSKGRDTKLILERYLKELPDSVMVFLEENNILKSTGTSTGTSSSVKDKVKDKVKDNTNTALQKFVSKWNENNVEKNIVRNTTTKKTLLPQCKKITSDMNTAWEKIKKLGYEQEAEIAIDNYMREIKGRDPQNEYARHRFSCYEFLKQENGLRKFINR